MNTYLRSVRRRLYLPGKLRRQELKLLKDQINRMLQEGQDWESLKTGLGSPAEAAEAIQGKYPQYRKSPWRFLFLAAGIFGILGLAYHLLLQLLLHFLLVHGVPEFSISHSSNASLGIIGGADGPTAVFVTGATVTGSLNPEFLLFLILAVLGLAGYFYLKHYKTK